MNIPIIKTFPKIGDRAAKIANSILLSAIFILLVGMVNQYFPLKSHWRDMFYPAIRAFSVGDSPFAVWGYYNPPWTLIILLPLGYLPAKLGSAVMSVVTLYAFIYICYRMGAKPYTALLFLINPLVAYNYFQVNVDWLILLGIFMPPQIGLFFVLMKPQLGGLIAFYWMVQAWRRGVWKETARLVLPVSLAFGITFLIYGLYPLHFSRPIDFELSFLPYSIPFGLALLWLAFRKDKPNWLLPSATLLTPYTQPYTWPLTLLGFLPNQAITIILLLLTWLVFIFNWLQSPPLPVFFQSI